MSQTYGIGCVCCREKLWIGQGWDNKPDERYIYAGEPETMKALQVFLFKHKGHELVFDSDIEGELEDFVDVTEDVEAMWIDRAETWVKYRSGPFICTCGAILSQAVSLYQHIQDAHIKKREG